LSNSRIQLSVNDSSAFSGAAASYGHAGDRGDAAPCHRPTVIQLEEAAVANASDGQSGSILFPISSLASEALWLGSRTDRF
jgi:hypothetical protein